MERALVEYMVNSAWQVPVIALAAWMAVRVGRPAVRVQHAVWVVALFAAVALPAISPGGGTTGRAGSGMALISDTASDSAAGVPRTGRALQPDWASSGLSGTLELKEERSTARGWFEGREWTFTTRWTRVVEALYLASSLFCLVRLVRSWSAAQAALRDSTPWTVTAEDAEALVRCCERLEVERPEIRISAYARSPLVLGARRAVILLPQDLTEEASGRGMEAVWWHELVHVRRHDYLANLLCRVWAVPISYHPVGHWIAQRVVRTREMACDAVAAELMASPVEYARSLLDLTQRIRSDAAAGLAGTGMFGDGALEERVMELLREKTKESVRTRVLRAGASAATLAAVLTGVAVSHVRPILAQEAQPAEAAALVVPAGAAAAVAPVRPAVEAAAPAVPAAPSRPVEVTPVEGPVRLVRVVAVAPVEPVGPVQQVEPVQPVQQVQPVEPVQTPRESGALSPEDAARIDKELPDAQRGVGEALKNLDNAAVRKKVDEAMRRLDSPEFKKKIDAAVAKAKEMNSPEMQKKIADAVAKAQKEWNSPEARKRMEELNSPEFRKRIEENAALAKQRAELFANSAEMQKEMAEIQKQLDATFNSPEWKSQMERFNSPEFKQKMDEMQRQLRESLKKLGEPQGTSMSAPPRKRSLPVAVEAVPAYRWVSALGPGEPELTVEVKVRGL